MRNLGCLTDEMLVNMYVEGDNEAFDAIINRHQERLFGYILHQVHDEDLANDIFQETFVKVILTLKQGRYQETGKLSAWITRIAHNLIIDHFRQTKAENLTSCDDETTNILNRKDLADTNIEDCLLEHQIQRDIRNLVNALPENQKEVLLMRYYHNMSFKEIADSTGVSINTALGRMRYAIINMRKIAADKNISLSF
mgnify:FL=1